MSLRCLPFACLALLFVVTARSGRAQGAPPPKPLVVERVSVPEEIAGGFPAYYDVLPVEAARGVLVLLPGLNGDTALPLRETSLVYAAAARGLATVLIPTRFVVAVDDSTRAFIDHAVRDAAARFGLPMDRAVIGGFSAGGLLALGYAVAARRTPEATAFTPRAVFTIDAPVDLTILHARMEREIERGCSEVGVYEARFVLDLMHEAFGPLPEAAETYAEASPFTYGRPEGGNARYLADLPVRLYHEPAIQWQLEQRCRSLYDNNVTDASALINTLRLAGNAQADLVLAEGRGYRARGERHPHTWALVEPGDLVTWMLAHSE